MKPSPFDGRDIAGRAELLGITATEFVRLASEDTRIVASAANATPHAVSRLRRWIEAGHPAPDVRRLVFVGHDQVRDVVRQAIESLPAPVAWHAVEHVMWFEVGRGTGGWTCIAPTFRAPAMDSAHVIVLDGHLDDHTLRGVIAHELGHSVNRALRALGDSGERQGAPRSTLEQTARLIAVARVCGMSTADVVRKRVDEELIADRAAEAWGFNVEGPDERALLRFFSAQHAEAEGRADAIDRDLDNNHFRKAV